MAIVGFNPEDFQGPRKKKDITKGGNLTRIVTDAGDPFRVEAWYPVFKEHTFDTTIIPLGLDEAKALMKCYETGQLLLFVELQEQGAQSEYGRRSHPRFDIDPEFAEPLGRLEQRLQDAIAAFGDGGAFVRLSTRSPKDAALDSYQLRALLREELTHRPVPQGENSDVEDMIGFTRALCKAMRVTTGREAMQFLLRSERSYEDISFCELHKQQAFDLNLIVRKWEDLDVELEFRVIVKNRSIIAITQYYPDCYVPSIASDKDAYLARILAFFNDVVRDNFNEEHYVVDVALCHNSDRVWIVEINNPPPVAGTALFNQDDPADKEIVFNGPFEYRVLTEPVRDPLSKIHAPVARFIRFLRGHVDESAPVHADTTCASCGMSPIRGHLLRCQTCPAPARDLCDSCYNVRVHDFTHVFDLYKVPGVVSRPRDDDVPPPRQAPPPPPPAPPAGWRCVVL